MSWVFGSIAATGIGERASGAGNEGRACLQQLLAVAERRDADVLEIVVGQPAQQLAVDIVGTEYLGILVEADPRANCRCPSSSPWALVSGSF